jgi:hypothetical protein
MDAGVGSASHVALGDRSTPKELVGTLFYGAARTPIRIDDRILAHLKAVVTAKMRRGEGFLISWTDSAEVGHGRSSVWVHPTCDIHYKFDGGAAPKLDPSLLEAMNIESIQAQGIELADATLAHSPNASR